MSTGLIALLDDIAAIAKVAAATIDDAAAQAGKAGAKAAGIVIDDAAVTPRYVVGFAADRELPIIWKIARGSLKNKMFFILPGALALAAFAPWLITPLLMIGGLYLCFEGYEKVADLAGWHGDHGHGKADADPDGDADTTPEELENERVSSAIRTDFILSAEIMAIARNVLNEADPAPPLWLLAVALAVVGFLMTVAVYGTVAVIVKADDVGVAMARGRTGLGRAIGRAIVAGMPGFLKGLSLIGMVAMLWVGGGIFTHGLHVLGVHAPEDLIKQAASTVAALVPALGGLLNWLVGASINAVIGLALGALVAPVMLKGILPALSRLSAKGKAAA